MVSVYREFVMILNTLAASSDKPPSAISPPRLTTDIALPSGMEDLACIHEVVNDIDDEMVEGSLEDEDMEESNHLISQVATALENLIV